MSQYDFGDKPPAPASSDEGMWGMLCHLSTFAGFIVPFGNILGPLIVWLVKKDEYRLVEDQGKEAMNFQISITIWYFVAGILCIILIGIPLLLALIVFDLVVTIMAALRANAGEYYRYPLTIRFIQ
jgi:uncharacterized Tic20 family protein